MWTGDRHSVWENKRERRKKTNDDESEHKDYKTFEYYRYMESSFSLILHSHDTFVVLCFIFMFLSVFFFSFYRRILNAILVKYGKDR